LTNWVRLAYNRRDKPRCLKQRKVALQPVRKTLVWRIADGFQPIQGFPPVRGVDFDACVLVGAHRLFIRPAFASAEGVQVEPQTEQVEPSLGCLATLKTAFDGQVGTQNAVGGFDGTTGANHAFQDVEQFFGQLDGHGVVGQEFSHQSRSEFGLRAESGVTVGDRPVQTPGPGYGGLEEGLLGLIRQPLGQTPLPGDPLDFQPIQEGQHLVLLTFEIGDQLAHKGVVQSTQSFEHFV